MPSGKWNRAERRERAIEGEASESQHHERVRRAKSGEKPEPRRRSLADRVLGRGAE